MSFIIHQKYGILKSHPLLLRKNKRICIAKKAEFNRTKKKCVYTIRNQMHTYE